MRMPVTEESLKKSQKQCQDELDDVLRITGNLDVAINTKSNQVLKLQTLVF